MSDASSVSSSTSQGSVSKSKMECPYCTSDIQVRSMFSHIRKLHTNDFLKATNRRWIEEATKGTPLRLWWSHKNDFDEDEETILFVCLGTNKTFTTEYGCQQHFKKDKTALKDHNKQITQLKKDFEAMKKQEAKQKKQKAKVDPFILRRDTAFKNNDPELARSIWRGILNHRKICEIAMMLCLRQCTPETPMYMFHRPSRQYIEVPFSTLKTYHDGLMAKLDGLLAAKCMDVKVLDAAYIETLTFWLSDYQESIMGLRQELKELHPLGDPVGIEKYYNYATDEMEGVDF